MSDQFKTVNAAICDHLRRRYPQIETTHGDGLRIPLGKIDKRRAWLRLGVRGGSRAFLRAMVVVKASEEDPLPIWMSRLADAAERSDPLSLRQTLEPVAREVQSFDQLELLRPVRFAEDKSWQWGPVVYTYTIDPPSMRAATRCVADLLEAIRPLLEAHVPGAAAALGAPEPV